MPPSPASEPSALVQEIGQYLSQIHACSTDVVFYLK